MAEHCSLCDKKVGMVHGYHPVANTTLCDKCYEKYEQVWDEIDNSEKFEKALCAFESNFNEKESVKPLVEHLKKLREEKIQQENNKGFEKNLKAESEKNNFADKQNSTGMFNNIGDKIKNLAQVLTWIGVVCSVFYGVSLMATDDDLILTGFIVIILGPLLSWISSFFLYGFGQLIENTDELVAISKKHSDDT